MVNFTTSILRPCIRVCWRAGIAEVCRQPEREVPDPVHVRGELASDGGGDHDRPQCHDEGLVLVLVVDCHVEFLGLGLKHTEYNMGFWGHIINNEMRVEQNILKYIQIFCSSVPWWS